MKELIALAGLAKTRVDAGFSRVGRKLSAAHATERALMILAARAIAQGNAVMALCERGLANESLPIMRGLAEACLAMRCVCMSGAGIRDRPGLAGAVPPKFGR